MEKRSPKNGPINLYLLFFWPYLALQEAFLIRDGTRAPMQWKCRVPTTGLPGKSQPLLFQGLGIN